MFSKRESEFYAAFTLNGFDDQEWNLTFEITKFQVLKLKFHAFNFKQAFYSLHKPTYWVTLTTQKYCTIIQALLSALSCQTCMCKRGISFAGRMLVYFLFSYERFYHVT